MKTLYPIFLLLLLTCCLSASAQDIIYKTSGEEIKAKVVKINPSRIFFKQPTLFPDSLFSLDRKEVFMVKYANGAKELMQAQAEENAPVEKTPGQMMQQGRLDAKRYYTGNKGLAGGAIAGVLFFPAIPVVAAIPPKITLKDVPDAQLLSNPYYYKGFRGQAHKRKVGKVAIGGGIALVTMVVLTSISAYSE